jgi:glycosyltransferase involved in cell wall biosynthesis
MKVYVLARNEEANIGKCLAALQQVGAMVTVLDSGSTDRTLDIAKQFKGVTVRPHPYVSHEKSYNDLTVTAGDEWIMVLDADMEVRPSLWDEIVDMTERQVPTAIGSPLQHCVAGKPLSWASLYPPKVYVFRGGQAYFVARGHGEQLRPGVVPAFTRAALVHNDLKGYGAFLQAQVFYGKKIIERWKTGKGQWYDGVRLYSPLMAIVMLLRALIMRLGFLDGRRGLAYAVDRMIAELIFFRLSLVEGVMGRTSSGDDSHGRRTRNRADDERDSVGLVGYGREEGPRPRMGQGGPPVRDFER